MDLIHLSFKSVGTKVWQPKVPDGMPEVRELIGEMAEPDTPRISVAPTVTQCLQSIWPNIYDLLTEKQYPTMDLHVYRPTGFHRVVPPDELTRERWVWDAHVTGEHWIIDPTKMEQIAKIRVKSPVYRRSDYAAKKTHPFNDPKMPETEVGPLEFTWHVINGKIPESANK